MNPRRVLPLLSLLPLLAGCAAGHLTPSTTALMRFGNGICRESKSGLMWQEEAGPAVSDWNEAKAQVANLRLGGYTDWRLPTKEELLDLLLLCERTRQTNCPKRLHTGHWLGSDAEEGEAGHWESYPLCDGVDYRFVEQQEGVVRAVRP